ncbi:MAG: hypothetical protein V3V08_13670 [Nannocystaceae bacterium]
MEFDPTHMPTSIEVFPTLDACWTDTTAANDMGLPQLASTPWIRDINLLVRDVIQKISRRLRQDSVTIELDLCPGVPEVAGDPQLMAFVIAGVIAAESESVADAERGVIRIKTEARPDCVKISVLGNSMPLLRFIRAISHADGTPGEMDPTMANCRRLLEAQGGWMELGDDADFVGFELNIPALPLCNPVRLFPSANVSVCTGRGPNLCIAS